MSKVFGTDYGSHLAWWESALIHYTDPVTFKMGDRVKYVGDMTSWLYGRTGTVTALWLTGDGASVRFDGDQHSVDALFRNLVYDVNSATFKMGDRVIVKFPKGTVMTSGKVCYVEDGGIVHVALGDNGRYFVDKAGDLELIKMEPSSLEETSWSDLLQRMDLDYNTCISILEADARIQEEHDTGKKLKERVKELEDGTSILLDERGKLDMCIKELESSVSKLSNEKDVLNTRVEALVRANKQEREANDLLSHQYYERAATVIRQRKTIDAMLPIIRVVANHNRVPDETVVAAINVLYDMLGASKYNE